MQTGERWTVYSTLIIVSLIVGGVFVGYSAFDRGGGMLSSLEQQTVDLRHRLFARPERARDDIVIVALTERSLNLFRDAIGRWPWPRTVHARLIRYLRHARTRTFDIGFFEPSNINVTPRQVDALRALTKRLYRAAEGDRDLKQQFEHTRKQINKLDRPPDKILGKATRGHEPTIHAATFTGQGRSSPEVYKEFFDQHGYAVEGERLPIRRSATLPVEELQRSGGYIGHINHVADADGTTRRFYPFMALKPDRDSATIKHNSVPTLGLAPFLYEQDMGPGQTLDGSAGKLSIGPTTLPLKHDGSALIHYAGGPGTFDRVPAECIIARIYGQKLCNRGYTPEWFRDKHVLIGATAAGLFDLRTTPFSNRQAGVTVHANILDMMLRDKTLAPAGPYVTAALIALGVLAVGTITAFLSPLPAFVLTILLLVLYLLTGAALFRRGIVLNLTTPSLAAATNYVFVALAGFIRERRRRQRLRSTFSSYLPESVLQEVLENPDALELGGQRRRITVLFADISGFTAFSESESSEAVADALGEVMTEMTECVFDHDGILDKYVGDELVAEFGMIDSEPPEHEQRAVQAASDMLVRLKRLRAEWEQTGREPFDLRIGLHTGEATTGNMGSSMLFDYTAIGDTVNTGSRLEGASKIYGTRCLMSSATRDAARGVTTRMIDRIRLKGKDEPVTVYELLGRDEYVSDDERELIERFETALEQYWDRQWEEALRTFERLHEQYDDSASNVFARRARHYKLNPPGDNWDGIYSVGS